MLGPPQPVLEVFERITLVLFIIAVGIDTLRTPRLVETKYVRRVRLRSVAGAKFAQRKRSIRSCIGC
jgi:hypothetical protein